MIEFIVAGVVLATAIYVGTESYLQYYRDATERTKVWLDALDRAYRNPTAVEYKG